VYDFNATLEVREQIAAFPDKTRPYLDDLITFLELTPWNGRSASDKDPDANMRTQEFGPHGEGFGMVRHRRARPRGHRGPAVVDGLGMTHPLDSVGEDTATVRV
jgi:hypothetical protein